MSTVETPFSLHTEIPSFFMSWDPPFRHPDSIKKLGISVLKARKDPLNKGRYWKKKRQALRACLFFDKPNSNYRLISALISSIISFAVSFAPSPNARPSATENATTTPVKSV